MLLLVYKPRGISSFDVVRDFRRILNTRKIGHAGTLDPEAEGLLLLATDGSTRLLTYLEHAHKTYICTMRLGAWSETGDVEGPIHEIVSEEISEEDFLHSCNKHVGTYDQIPPKYSAIKIDGTPAYKRARNGEEVIIKPRNVTIRNVELQKYNYPEAIFKTQVSSGTYIRSLADDIAIATSSRGYCTSIIRTRINNLEFTNTMEMGAYKVQKLEFAQVFPEIQHIQLTDANYRDIVNGKKIPTLEDIQENTLYHTIYPGEKKGAILQREGHQLIVVRNHVEIYSDLPIL